MLQFLLKCSQIRCVIVVTSYFCIQFCSWTMWAPAGYTLSLRILHYQMEAADRAIIQTRNMTHEYSRCLISMPSFLRVLSPLTLFVSSNDTLNFVLETDDEGTLGGISMLVDVTSWLKHLFRISAKNAAISRMIPTFYKTIMPSFEVKQHHFFRLRSIAQMKFITQRSKFSFHQALFFSFFRL